MEYILPFIVFLAAVIAIKGGAWDARQSGYRKITKTGYLTAVLALTALVVSIPVMHAKNTEAKESSRKLSQAVQRSEELKKQLTFQFYEASEQAKAHENLLSVLREENDKSQDELKEKVDDLNELNKNLYSENKELVGRLSELKIKVQELAERNIVLQQSIDQSVRIVGKMKDKQDEEAEHSDKCRELARSGFACAGNACGTYDYLREAGCY